MQTKRQWFEKLTPKQNLHWVSAGRSGGQYPVVFPDLPVAISTISKKSKKKITKRNRMAKNSRRANR